MKRHLRPIIAALFASTVVTAPASAQTDPAAWPQRPVRMVVGYPPGGTLDIVSRGLANALQQELGQPFLVENRAGAGGLVGAQSTLTSTRDGYTLLMAIGSHTVLPALRSKMPYDTLNDFAPVAMVGTSPNMLVVRADHPARTLDDFLKAARASSDRINYGTPGIGTTTHVTGVMVEQASKVAMNHVPYKGSAGTTQALLAGEVPVVFASIVSAGGAIRDGRMRALGIVGEQRSKLLPAVPTFTEQGVPGVLGNNWLGLLAPGGTPQAVIDRLAETIERIVASPQFQSNLRDQGVEPQLLKPTAFGKMLADEVASYRKVVDAAGMRTD